ncbi:hypothetical protein PN36_04955 [Candidatus Thiomargarita nelsonii]|uniref:ATPase AAA-type core domain-containing protein n=1 Tax=Candidatus Thiomargarita nelsonii TaxID=1003181 RepID=A0A0A6RPE4_9GAMM|nr:hypothetical protein PN36_04955 [Candidatus Thiomargarita nelsonii]
MLKKLQVQNFKSILSDTVELGQLNVFIGENGSGKSNLLESLAVMSAAKQERLDIEGLYSKGVRVAKPELTFSSFHGKKQKPQIEMSLAFQSEKQLMTIKSIIETDMTDEAVVKWKDSFEQKEQEQEQQDILKHVLSVDEDKIKLIRALSEQKRTEKSALYHPIQNYLIYNLDTKALRGFSSESKKVPLGINGEGLDVLLANFSEPEFTQLQEYAYFVNWLDEIVIDREDLMKFSYLKQGKSISKLYFKDKFMMKKENIFSAENANEGVLHILFYLALFISQKTPTLFAIDNIESHLNPHLCTELTRVICKLAKKTNKQALITTHNPAILDGLNLNDDDIRLFEIYRNDEGHTKTRRIQLNPETKPIKVKLSELWMRGYLGAISKQF